MKKAWARGMWLDGRAPAWWAKGVGFNVQHQRQRGVSIRMFTAQGWWDGSAGNGATTPEKPKLRS